MSRTELLLDVLAEALDARATVAAVRKRYSTMGGAPENFGEPPLEQSLKPYQARYLEKLEALRAHLTLCGVQA